MVLEQTHTNSSHLTAQHCRLLHRAVDEAEKSSVPPAGKQLTSAVLTLCPPQQHWAFQQPSPQLKPGECGRMSIPSHCSPWRHMDTLPGQPTAAKELRSHAAGHDQLSKELRYLLTPGLSKNLLPLGPIHVILKWQKGRTTNKHLTKQNSSGPSS